MLENASVLVYTPSLSLSFLNYVQRKGGAERMPNWVCKNPKHLKTY